MRPIAGMRLRCVHCNAMDMCSRCYFRGRHSNGRKPASPGPRQDQCDAQRHDQHVQMPQLPSTEHTHSQGGGGRSRVHVLWNDATHRPAHGAGLHGGSHLGALTGLSMARSRPNPETGSTSVGTALPSATTTPDSHLAAGIPRGSSGIEPPSET